jgi:hypothetical protein
LTGASSTPRLHGSITGISGILGRPAFAGRRRLKIKKAGTCPPFSKTCFKPDARAELKTPPGPENYFFFLAFDFFAFFAFFAFLAIVTSQEFHGLKRDTRHARRRASLAISSTINSTDSRRAASRCHVSVIALSTVVMHFDAFFREMTRAVAGARANEASLPRQAIASNAASLIMLNGSPTRSSSIQNQGRD